MISQINETHDPELTSWVDSANDNFTDFPIQNLPFSVFSNDGSTFQVGVGIGDYVLDISKVGSFLSNATKPLSSLCASPSLLPLMSAGSAAWSDLRMDLSKLLRSGSKYAKDISPHLHATESVAFAMPCQIGDFTDFYSSIHHATAIGKLFRPDNPLLPNYKWVPIAYHGRASSVDISGQEFRRPWGQIKAPDQNTPSYQPTSKLDFELEMGILIGTGNELGMPITMESAESCIFGLCLLNDWSARDIQAWEYQPLGPFLAKSFASTISPWMVTMEALAPFRTSYSRPSEDPEPLPHLTSGANSKSGGLDVSLEVSLQSNHMKQKNIDPQSLARSNFSYSYWTTAQMVTHHASNGCNLRAGDLLGTGTQSGPILDQAGSMLELSQGGQVPIELLGGEKRLFIEDGDNVIMRAWCEKAGATRIGFGSVESKVVEVDPDRIVT